MAIEACSIESGKGNPDILETERDFRVFVIVSALKYLLGHLEVHRTAIAIQEPEIRYQNLGACDSSSQWRRYQYVHV